MALYYVNLKVFSRSKGQSSVNAAAYRAGVSYTDERTGVLHNYAKKGGVLSVKMDAPAHAPSWVREPEQLWNRVEAGERVNGRPARELLTALPAELSLEQNRELTQAIARFLVERYAVAVMSCIHAPDKKGDERNVHCHFLFTTREITANGLGKKTRRLDEMKNGADEIEVLRSMVARLTNQHLARAGAEARIDHRSLITQSIDAEQRGDFESAIRLARASTGHEGQSATAAARRGEETPQVRLNAVIHAGNITVLRTAVDLAQGELIEQRRTSTSRALQGVRSRARTRVHVETKHAATGDDAELLNEQARLSRESARLDAQLSYQYDEMIEDIVRSMGSNASAVLAYVRRQSIQGPDLRALIEHTRRAECIRLLNQIDRADRSQQHAASLIQRRRHRSGKALVRTQRAKAALYQSAGTAPRNKRQWAQLRRAQERALDAAQRNEMRAERLITPQAEARTHARVRAAIDRLDRMEHQRRQRFPLPGDIRAPHLIAPAALPIKRARGPRPQAATH